MFVVIAAMQAAAVLSETSHCDEFSDSLDEGDAVPRIAAGVDDRCHGYDAEVTIKCSLC